MSATIPAQRFGPSSGGVTGGLGLLFCAAVSVIVLADEVSTASIRVVLGACAVAVVLWAYLLRPRVIIESGGTLLLRNAFADWQVPLAGIKVVGVRAVTTVKTADGGRYDGVGVGRSVRNLVRGSGARDDASGGGIPMFGMPLPRMPAPDPPPTVRASKLTDQSLPDFVTEQILNAADRARALGIPDGPARRLYAIPELVALGVVLVALTVSFAF